MQIIKDYTILPGNYSFSSQVSYDSHAFHSLATPKYSFKCTSIFTRIPNFFPEPQYS